MFEVIFDDNGKPYDLRYVEANPAFEKQMGRSAIVGQNSNSIFPGIEQYWFDFFGKVAVSGIPAHKEDEYKHLDKCIDVYANKIGDPDSRRVGVLFRDITNKKKIAIEKENYLKIAEEKRAWLQIRMLLAEGEKFTHIGSFEYDVATCEMFWSDEEFRLFGLEPGPHSPTYDELMQNHFHPEDTARLEQYFAKVLNSDSSQEIEYRIVRPDRSVRNLYSIAQPVFDTARKIVKYVGATLDITERKRAEEALLEQESILHSINQVYEKAMICGTLEELGCACLEILQSATQSAISFVGEIGGDGLFHDIAISETGWAECTMYDQTGHRRPPSSLPIRGLYGSVLKSGKSLLENHPSAHPESVGVPEGHPKLSNFLGVPFLRDGKITGMIAVANCEGGFTEKEKTLLEALTPTVLEVMLRKRAEEALRQSETKLWTVLENSRDSINMMDLKTGKYVYMSPSLVELTGFSAEEMNNFSVEERFARIHPEDLAVSVKHKKATEVGSKDYEDVEYRWMVKNGEYRWFSDRSKLVRNEQGEPAYIVVISRDITERKRAEEALRASEQKALALVANLKKADKNKSQFISILSHELRNPLAVISASLSLLEITQNPDLVSRTKESLNRQVGQLTKLVDDLLDLTRINQNKIKLKKEDLDLSELLQNAARDIIPAYKKKGIRLDVKLPTAPLFLNADPVRIAQCAGNLLQNALKFTPATGEVILSLEKENEEAVIRVQDNGVGIRPDMLEHVFEAFTQADTSLARTNSGGLGLGLSIVDGIVRLHGGSITAFSEGDGKGSLFTIKLPVLTQPADTQHKAAVNKQARNLRILVIDDNKDLTDILCAVIESMGHQVRAAYNGPDGITEAKEIRPDVIFCDIGLPGMNGYEVAKVLKSDPALKDTLLIALTGYAGEDDIKTANAAGFDMHLKKPVDMAALEKILTKIENII